MKYEYVKRTSKKKRQALLEQVLAEELEYLRKKCFPWQKRKFLFSKIEIKENEFDDWKTLGTYYKKEAGKHEYKHVIEIKKNILLGCQKVAMYYYRKQYYKQLKSVIRHELVHAFCQEMYEGMFSVKQTGADASPIFAIVLAFVNAESGHKCYQKFLHTDIYKKALTVDTFKELDNYIFDLLIRYREATRGLENINNQDDFKQLKTKNLYTIVNQFEFASRNCGLTKKIELNNEDIIKVQDKICKNICINRTWEIGCNVRPEQLVELYNRKQDCKAEYYDTKKIYNVLAADKQVKQITVREEKNI